MERSRCQQIVAAAGAVCCRVEQPLQHLTANGFDLRIVRDARRNGIPPAHLLRKPKPEHEDTQAALRAGACDQLRRVQVMAERVEYRRYVGDPLQPAPAVPIPMAAENEKRVFNAWLSHLLPTNGNEHAAGPDLFRIKWQ